MRHGWKIGFYGALARPGDGDNYSAIGHNHGHNRPVCTEADCFLCDCDDYSAIGHNRGHNCPMWTEADPSSATLPCYSATGHYRRVCTESFS